MMMVMRDWGDEMPINANKNVQERKQTEFCGNGGNSVACVSLLVGRRLLIVHLLPADDGGPYYLCDGACTCRLITQPKPDTGDDGRSAMHHGPTASSLR